MVQSVNRFYCLVAYLGVTMAGMLFSADPDSSDWVVPPMNQADLLLYKQSLLPNQSMKLQVLEELTDRWHRGVRSVEDPSVLYILEYLAGEGVHSRIQSSEPRDFPLVRRKAVFLLGLIGGERARKILDGVLLQDPEPMVVAEAIHALRRNHFPLTSEEMQGLLAVFSRQILPKRDANLAYAALLLLRDCPLTYGNPLVSNLFSQVLALLDLPFSKEIKELASEWIHRWIQPVENRDGEGSVQRE
ncbi:MAG: hypothetical protein Kow009_08580 [Spirochaetales bacterium]